MEELGLNSNKIANVNFGGLVGTKLHCLDLWKNPIMSVDFNGIERISYLDTLYIKMFGVQNVYNFDHLKKSKLYQMFKIDPKGVWSISPY